MEQFSSLKEIDTRLRILRLQREISLEQLNAKRHEFQSHFQVPVLGEELRDNVKKTVIFVVASFLLRRLRRLIGRKALAT